MMPTSKAVRQVAGGSTTGRVAIAVLIVGAAILIFYWAGFRDPWMRTLVTSVIPLASVAAVVLVCVKASRATDD